MIKNCKKLNACGKPVEYINQVKTEVLEDFIERNGLIELIRLKNLNKKQNPVSRLNELIEQYPTQINLIEIDETQLGHSHFAVSDSRSFMEENNHEVKMGKLIISSKYKLASFNNKSQSKYLMKEFENLWQGNHQKQ